MHKIARIAVVTNLVLALFFVYANLEIWRILNNALTVTLKPSYWYLSAIDIQYDTGMLDQTRMPNFPFWIFFIAIAINLYFIYKLSKKPNTQ
jgi:hypothetical protein